MNIFTLKFIESLSPFLCPPLWKCLKTRFNKGIEGNRTIIIKCSMERENGGFVAFGGFWFFHFRPLFSLRAFVAFVAMDGDMRGGLAGRLAGWERRGKASGGRGSRSRCAFLAVVALALAVGLTACDLCSYNARKIDMGGERGKSGWYCFRGFWVFWFIPACVWFWGLWFFLWFWSAGRCGFLCVCFVRFVFGDEIKDNLI